MNTLEAVLLTSQLACHGSGRCRWLRAVRAVDQRRPSHVVGPLMAAEGGTAVVLGLAPPHGVSRLWPLLGLAALGVVRTSTVSRPVRTNWVRTVGWSISGIIVAMMVVQVVSS